MAIDAGGIEYEIDVKTGSLLAAEKQTDRFNKTATQGFNRTEKEAASLTTTMTKLAAAVGGVLALQGFGSFVNQTSAAIDQQAKFADRIQISFEELQKLQFVAGQTGVATQNLNTALQRMSRRLQDVAQGGSPAVLKQLQQMGIAIEDIKDLAPEDQFLAIADGFNTLTTESAKTLAAFSLFDTEGVGLTNTLRLGSEGIKELAGTLEEVGGVVSREVAADFEAFNDRLDITSRAVEGLKVQFLASLLPAFNDVAQGATDLVSDGEKVRDIIDGIGIAAQATAVVLTARAVGAFVAYIAQMAAATRATIAASAAQVAYTRNLAVGTTAIVAQTVAARGLSVVMAALGGPAGLIIAAAGALLLLAANAGEAEESLADLNARGQELEGSFKSFTEDQVNDSLAKLRKRSQEASVELEKLSKIKIGEKGFFEAQERIRELKKTIQSISEKENILLKIEFDRNNPKKAEDEGEKVGKAFARSVKKFTPDDLFNIAEGAADTVRTPLEKILAEEKTRIAQVEAIYKQLEPIYKDDAEFLRIYTEAKDNIRQDSLNKQKELTDQEVKDLEDQKSKIIDIEKSANKDLLDERGKIISDAEDQISALKTLAKEEPKLAADAARAIVAIQARRNKDLKKLDDDRSKQQEDIRRSVLDIEKDANNALLNERDLLIAQYDQKISDLEEVAMKEPALAADVKRAVIAIEAQKNKDLKKLDDDRIKQEKEKQEELKKQREAQEELNKSFLKRTAELEFRTPIEEINFREKQAIAELKELYAETTLPIQELEDAITDIQRRASEDRNAILQAEKEARLSTYADIAAGGAALFGNLAEIASSAKGETSTAYRALFAISKGFAVAQAGLNFSLALTNALASGPFPANLAAVAATASAGASLISAVGSATYSGRANGGPVSAGNQYRINENGRPEVFSYGNSDYLMAGRNGTVQQLDDVMSGDGMGLNIQIINQTSAAIGNVQTQQLSRNDVVVIIQETVPGEINNPNSKTSRALLNSTSAQRRLT